MDNAGSVPAPDMTGSRKKCRSLSARLRRRFAMFAVLGATMPLLALVMMGMHLYTAPLLAVYGLYGLACACGSLYMRHRLADTTFVSLPTVKAIDHVYRLRRLRRRIQFAAVAGMVLILIWMFAQMFCDGRQTDIWGAIVGLVFGLAIGIFVDQRMSQDLRRLQQSLDGGNEL